MDHGRVELEYCGKTTSILLTSMANETIGQKHSGWQHRELSFVIGCFGLDLRCFEFTSGTGH